MFQVAVLLAVSLTACISGLSRSNDENSRIVLDIIPGMGTYFYNGKSKTSWDVAYTMCADEGAHLVIIDSVEEAEALKTLMTTYASGAIHVGFTDKITEGTYTFINDQPVDATLWASGFPKDDATLNCGGFSAAGLADISCGSTILLTRTSFCELRNKQSYDLVPGLGYYNYHVDERIWADAWEVCQAEGGHLFVPDALDEVETIMRSYPDWGDVWVGAHRLNGADIFTTILGKPLDSITFNKWIANHPFGDSASRPYVALQRGDVTGLWSHTPSGKLPFICEQAL